MYTRMHQPAMGENTIVYHGRKFSVTFVIASAGEASVGCSDKFFETLFAESSAESFVKLSGI